MAQGGYGQEYGGDYPQQQYPQQAYPQQHPVAPPAGAPPKPGGMGKTIAIAVVILVIASVMSAVAFIALSAAPPPPPPPNGNGGTVTLKIGVILSQSGQLGHDGQIMVQGVKLKADEINAAGGFKLGNKTAKIDLVVEDDGTDPNKGRVAAEKLVNVDKVQAIVGDTGSTICLAIETVTGPAKVPIVSPSCTSPKLTTKPWIFRTVGSDVFQGKAMADVALALKKASKVGNKVALFAVANDYGLGVKDENEKRVAANGMEVIFNQQFLENQVDYDALAASLKSAKDAQSPTEAITVLYTSYPEDAITFFGSVGKLGLTPANGYIWVGNDGIANSDVFVGNTNVNQYIQNMYVTNPTSKPGDADWQKFHDAFKTKYGFEPTAYAGTAYDALTVIVEAIKKAGKYDGTAIKDALNSFTGADAFKGVSGVKDYDANGDIKGQFYQIYKVSGTKFVATGGWWEDPTKGIQDFNP
jgi:branched-chain amino acid transport system substrate-binding protein